MSVPNKKLYALVRDGIILPDTHIFRFQSLATAIFTFYLFCVTFRSKSIKLKCVGEVNEYGEIVSNQSYIVCDFDSGIDCFINLPTDIKDICGFKLEDLYTIISDVEKAIENLYKEPENEQVDRP